MFKARKVLEFKSLLSLYFSFLKRLFPQKKKLALILIFKKGKFETVTNIFQKLKFLFSTNDICETFLMFLNRSSPKIFTFKFQSIDHQ